jgi:hypothetical protein
VALLLVLTGLWYFGIIDRALPDLLPKSGFMERREKAALEEEKAREEARAQQTAEAQARANANKAAGGGTVRVEPSPTP